MTADNAPRATARILHSALLAGPLLFAAAVFYLHSQGPALPPAAEQDYLLYTAYLIAAAAYAAAIFLRGRILPPPSGGDAAWWKAALPRMTVLWALVEGPMMLGVAVFLVTRDLPLLLSVTGLGALLMLLFSPDRLAGS